ncbi:TPA: DUF551 domain-containing protein, partial [Klebsiella pneumoniae]
TGDWLYDDPIELAKAIRKGPDMPPAQPVADSEPVIVVGDDGGDALSYRRLIQSFEPGTKLYRHAQPAPEKYNIGDATMRHIFTPTSMTNVSDMQAVFDRVEAVLVGMEQPAPVVPGKWIPVSERMPEDDDFVYIWPRPDFGVELHIGQYCERNHKGGGWYAQVYEQNYGIEWHPITVTHWMPLPVAPQEEK